MAEALRHHAHPQPRRVDTRGGEIGLDRPRPGVGRIVAGDATVLRLAHGHHVEPGRGMLGHPRRLKVEPRPRRVGQHRGLGQVDVEGRLAPEGAFERAQRRSLVEILIDVEAKDILRRVAGGQRRQGGGGQNMGSHGAPHSLLGVPPNTGSAGLTTTTGQRASVGQP